MQFKYKISNLDNKRDICIDILHELPKDYAMIRTPENIYLILPRDMDNNIKKKLIDNGLSLKVME